MSVFFGKGSSDFSVGKTSEFEMTWVEPASDELPDELNLFLGKTKVLLAFGEHNKLSVSNKELSFESLLASNIRSNLFESPSKTDDFDNKLLIISVDSFSEVFVVKLLLVLLEILWLFFLILYLL